MFIEDPDPKINYQRYAIFFRGSILNHMSALEASIEDFISCFFFKDEQAKRLSFQNILGKKFKVFDTKAEMMLEIITDHKLLDDDKIKQLREDLKDVLHKRNIAAHWQLFLRPEEYNKFDIKNPSIRLFRLKNGVKPDRENVANLECVDFTQENMSELMPKIHDCVMLIMSIRNNIGI